MATFDSWLEYLASANKGPATLVASRGRAFRATISLNADYTAATMRGSIRLNPDDAGSVLANFTVSAASVVSGVTTFTLTLAAGSGANSTGVLPADPNGEGVIDLAYDLLLTPSGGTEELLFGGTFRLLGRVTA